MGQSDPNIDVRANADQAMGRLAAVQQQADHLSNDEVSIPVEASDTTAAMAQIQAMSREVDSANAEMSLSDRKRALAAMQALEQVGRAQAAYDRAQQDSAKSAEVLARAENSFGQSEARLNGLRQEAAAASEREAMAGLHLANVTQSQAIRLQEMNDRMDASNAKMDDAAKKTDTASQKMSLLWVAAAALGPAIVPVGLAAVGLGASLGAMGAVGMLAFKGIQAEMKNGSQQGQQYSSLVKTLKGDLTELETTAASGVLKPFSTVVGDLQTKMPGINHDVGLLAGTLGQVMVPAADGVLTAFTKLSPMIQTVSGYVVQLAQQFDAFAHGGGLSAFGATVTTVMPTVMGLIEQLIPLVANLAGSFVPMGTVSAEAMTLLTQALNIIPTPVLQILSSGAVSVYLAFQAWKGIQSIIGAVASGLSSLSGSMASIGASGMAAHTQAWAVALGAEATNADEAAASTDALATSAGAASTNTGELAANSTAAAAGTGELAAESGAAAAEVDALAASADTAAASEDALAGGMALVNPVLAGIAAVVGIATFAWSQYTAGQQRAKEAQQEMTQAIQQDNGVVGENTKQRIANTVATGDLAQKAQEYGINLKTLTGAMQGNSADLATVNSKLQQNGQVTDKASGAAANYASQSTHLASNAQSVKDAVDKSSKSVSNSIGIWKKQQASLDASNSSAKALTQTQKDQALSEESLTGATKAQAQAIQNLNSQMQQEISMQLQLQGGLTGIAAAEQQMDAQLKKTRSSTSLNTAAGVANRQAIEQTVGQLQSYISTEENNGKTTAQATSEYKTQAAQLLQNIAKVDGINSATYKYAQQLLKVPKDVNTKVGMTGTSVAASQLKGLSKQAKDLGAQRVEIPTGTPNAKQTAQLLNDISDAALSANLKKVTIPTSSATAVATKLKIDGISGAVVSANKKSVIIPTSALNTAKTRGEIEDVINSVKDKTLTVTARGSQFDHVFRLLEEAHAQAYNQTFTITAVYAKQNAGGGNLARHGKGYASGTDDALAGLHPLGERGPELVMSKSIGRLLAGSIVLNGSDTSRTLAGDPGPIMRATGANAATATYQTTHNSPIYIGQVVGADVDSIERQMEERRRLEAFSGRRA